MENNKLNAGNAAISSTDSLGVFTDPHQIHLLIAESRSEIVRSARHYNYVYGSHLRKEDVEDAVQDAICKAMAKVAHYDSRKAKVSTWVCRIVRNEIVDRLKQQAISITRDVRYIDDSGEDGAFDEGVRQLHFRRDEEEGASGPIEYAEGRMLSRLRIECISRAVGGLNKRDQRVIAMLMQKVPGAVMAHKLGITETAQRKLVHDVRKRLRRELEIRNYQKVECFINAGCFDVGYYDDEEDMSLLSVGQ
ncbi:MAG: sigma-70 family RNA polymerase sigma factor [Bacteroidales bacterium]|nr:sigma-70 family RNA polymerase sigma factor [Bacteroidales bacterium]